MICGLICALYPEQRTGRAWLGNRRLRGPRPRFHRGVGPRADAQFVIPELAASAAAEAAPASTAAASAATTAATSTTTATSATTAAAMASANAAASTAIVAPAIVATAVPTTAVAAAIVAAVVTAGRRAARSYVVSKGSADTGKGVADATGEALQGGYGRETDQRHNEGVLSQILRMLVSKHALQK